MRSVLALGLLLASACIGRDSDRSDFTEHLSCESLPELQQACAKARETDVCCENGVSPACSDGTVASCEELGL